jgi:hypothetical protein
METCHDPAKLKFAIRPGVSFTLLHPVSLRSQSFGWANCFRQFLRKLRNFSAEKFAVTPKYCVAGQPIFSLSRTLNLPVFRLSWQDKFRENSRNKIRFSAFHKSCFLEYLDDMIVLGILKKNCFQSLSTGVLVEIANQGVFLLL